MHHDHGEKMAFSLEVEVRFINRMGFLYNKGIDHMMVITIQIALSFFWGVLLCLSKHAPLFNGRYVSNNDQYSRHMTGVTNQFSSVT